MSEQQEDYIVCQLPTKYGRLCSRGCHVMVHTVDGKEEIVHYDYPAAARTTALWLSEFCDTSLAYPAMIADAAKRATREIDTLRAALNQRDDFLDARQRELANAYNSKQMALDYSRKIGEESERYCLRLKDVMTKIGELEVEILRKMQHERP